MRLLYSALLYLLAPFLLLRLFWHGLTLREYWRRIPERFGRVAAVQGGVAVWVHAVSVGEAIAAMPLIKHLVATHPPHSVLVTTTTPTGSARVQEALGASVLHSYAPYDLPHAVNRFLQRVRPARVIVMETELWPNLFYALSRRKVPLVIANGRLSPQSFPRYLRLPGFTAGVLAQCSVIAAQSQADADRFLALGAPASRVRVMGNLKFDIELPAALIARGRELRERLGAQRPVWVAASTHEGEEQAVLDAHIILRRSFPDAVLILVPRHPQRFDAVARMIERSGLAFVRRSTLEDLAALPDSSLSSPVLLGDSMGELVLFLATADVAFVGGSLVPVGGHNVLEPAALGVPVLFGPHMFNFDPARELLLDCEAARQIGGARDLAPMIESLLKDAALRTRMGLAGKKAVSDNRGALRRLLDLIETA